MQKKLMRRSTPKRMKWPLLFRPRKTRRVEKPDSITKVVNAINYMNAEITNVDGDLVTARISGQLTETDLSALQHATGDIIKQQGKVRLLVLAENFAGWQKGGTWSDLSFQM